MKFEGLPAPGQGVLGGDKEEPLTLSVHLAQAKTADDIFISLMRKTLAYTDTHTIYTYTWRKKNIRKLDPVSIFFNFLKVEHRLS